MRLDGIAGMFVSRRPGWIVLIFWLGIAAGVAFFSPNLTKLRRPMVAGANMLTSDVESLRRPTWSTSRGLTRRMTPWPWRSCTASGLTEVDPASLLSGVIAKVRAGGSAKGDGAGPRTDVDARDRRPTGEPGQDGLARRCHALIVVCRADVARCCDLDGTSGERQGAEFTRRTRGPLDR